MKTNSNNHAPTKVLTVKEVFYLLLDHHNQIVENFKTHGKENADETNSLLFDLDRALAISAATMESLLKKMDEMEGKK